MLTAPAMTVILVIEDDAAIRDGVLDVLEAAGYGTLSARDGREGHRLALSATFDLVLLDLVLPHVDGFAILRELKRVRPTAPVIILSALGMENDRVTGLNLGADDYVVKPFGARELLARVHAVLRRSPERPVETPLIGFVGGTADVARREVRFACGSREELSQREADLLHYLAAHRGRAISREEIITRIWRLPAGRADTRTIDMHIAHLRAKLRDDPTDPRVILTVRGRGYMFAESTARSS